MLHSRQEVKTFFGAFSKKRKRAQWSEMGEYPFIRQARLVATIVGPSLCGFYTIGIAGKHDVMLPKVYELQLWDK